MARVRRRQAGIIAGESHVFGVRFRIIAREMCGAAGCCADESFRAGLDGLVGGDDKNTADVQEDIGPGFVHYKEGETTRPAHRQFRVGGKVRVEGVCQQTDDVLGIDGVVGGGRFVVGDDVCGYGSVIGLGADVGVRLILSGSGHVEGGWPACPSHNGTSRGCQKREQRNCSQQGDLFHNRLVLFSNGFSLFFVWGHPALEYTRRRNAMARKKGGVIGSEGQPQLAERANCDCRVNAELQTNRPALDIASIAL